jgi:predicted 2-oxoglutarate/Fe(II)-dependent dioxygenase YbiX
MRKLDSYIFVLKNFLDKKKCKETIKQLQDVKWEEHLFYNNPEKRYETRSGNKELDTTYSEIENHKIIMDKLHPAITTYLENIKSNVFTQWAGYTYVRFNRYTKTKKMAEHCDHIHTIFDGNVKGVPILSIVGLLNNDFTGGEFYLDKKHIKLKAGDLLIFPSSFVYPHQVKSVQKGTRYSFVSWVY